MEAANMLKEALRRKGFADVDRFPDSAISSIVAEALRNAAAEEGDGVARVGEFFDQIESAAEDVIATYTGKLAADHRIRTILMFHKLV